MHGMFIPLARICGCKAPKLMVCSGTFVNNLPSIEQEGAFGGNMLIEEESI